MPPTPQLTDIPDSTDFLLLPTPLPALSALDSSLRCQICKDHFTNPVITSCSHTFCSLCIRRSLSLDGKCPACRSADQEVRLRRNWGVQEAVDAWRGARGEVLGLARKLGEGEALDGRGMKTRKREVESEAEPEVRDGGEERSPKKRLRASTRRKEVKYYADIDLTGEGDTYDDEYRDEEEVITTTDTTAQNTPRDSYQQSTEAAAVSAPTTTTTTTATATDGLVPCPICNRRMKHEFVFSHLDKCPGPQPPSTSTSSRPSPSKPTPTPTPTPTPSIFHPRSPAPAPARTSYTRLPALNYTLFKDSTLRRKLKSLGIPDWGPKHLLQRRHREWVNLWNANCDAVVPKGKGELLRELEVWERTMGGNTNGYGNTGEEDVSRKEFDREGWGRSNAGSFRELIEVARRGRRREDEVRRGGEGEGEEKEKEGGKTVEPAVQEPVPSQEDTQILQPQPQPQPAHPQSDVDMPDRIASTPVDGGGGNENE